MNDDSGISAFGKFIPGFDFLKNLASAQTQAGKGASSPLSGLSNWVAPTVSVEELDKRIKELKAVLFWLEQNATALKATVQALEVQKMTLATLAGMNMSMAEVAKAFTIPTAPDQPQAPASAEQAGSAPAPSTSSQPWPFNAAPQASPVSTPAPEEPEPEPEEAQEEEPVSAPEPAPAASAGRAKKAAANEGAPAPAVADPMQWWGALTQQFQQIAADALRDVSAHEPAAKPSGKMSSPGAGKSTSKSGSKSTGKMPVVKSEPLAGGQASATARKSVSKKSVAKKPLVKTAAKKTATKKPAAKKSVSGTVSGGWPLPLPSRRK
ncbi:PhaM family polyhydroxyalkanoate granule multifunctional regulatory protein [Ottowia thiooxydans]|uniref:Alginate regulatory protein AlgP n=1 Tax=Ottowia thiooxydans TaxID=219182 RepID=A0ABV2QEW9_9BURK